MDKWRGACLTSQNAETRRGYGKFETGWGNGLESRVKSEVVAAARRGRATRIETRDNAGGGWMRRGRQQDGPSACRNLSRSWLTTVKTAATWLSRRAGTTLLCRQRCLEVGSTSPRRHTDVYEIRVPRCQRTVLKKKVYGSRLNSSTWSRRRHKLPSPKSGNVESGSVVFALGGREWG